MFNKLLIALKLKKKPQPLHTPNALDTSWGYLQIKPMPMKPATYAETQRAYAPPTSRPSSAPAPAPDTSSDLANTLFVASPISSGAHSSECKRAPEAEPFSSGGDGDFGGGGATGSWESSATSQSYDSGSSSDSSSSSSSSSD